MIVLISPAKKQDFSAPEYYSNHRKHAFADITTDLVMQLRKLDEQQLQKVLGVSASLAQLNYERFQNFQENLTTAGQAALSAYQGDVYRYMDLPAWSEQTLQHADERLLIISGLYGAVRASTKIAPYRLEMANRLPFIEGSLQAYWSSKVTALANEMATESQHSFLLNLASNEYSSVIDRKQLVLPMIDVQFLEAGPNGKLRTVAVNAKRARGAFAAACLSIKQPTVDDLYDICVRDYQFDQELSTLKKLVFVKRT